MCGISKFLKSALPAIAGFAFGGPVGAALGLEGGVGAAAGGALAGGLTGAATGQGFGRGAIGGGLGGFGGEFAASGGFGGGALPASITQASDPIAAINAAMETTGASTATAAAQQLGFGSADAMLAAANPAFVTGAAGALAGPSNALYNLGFPGAAKAVSGASSLLPSAIGGGATGLGPVGGALQIGGALYGLTQADQMRKAAMASDPMAAMRPEYARQLQALQANPSSITSMPGYEAGLEAVQRSMASQGYQGSGNMMAALQKYGGDFYQQQFNNLASLAGAGISPQIGLQGRQAAGNETLSSLGLLAGGARSFGY